MTIQRDDVISALRPEDVSDAYGMGLRFRGRWARTRRCPLGDHHGPQLAVARDGAVRCHAHQWGGGLLHLVAAFEGIDIKTDFGKVLERAAEIAGVEDSDSMEWRAPRPPRPAPPMPSLPERVRDARDRAAWLWSRLCPVESRERVTTQVRYLGQRGISVNLWAPVLRATPVLISRSEAEAAGGDLLTIWKMWCDDVVGVCVPVHHVSTGEMTDVRCRVIQRREEDGPKIFGMVGGVTSQDGELVAAYGRPHDLSKPSVVVCEGAFDWLTLAQTFPEYDVIGAISAGDYPLVATHAAAYCAEVEARLVLVAQDDGAGGAADRSVDRAAAEAFHVLPTSMVTWVEMAPRKDANQILAHDGPGVLRAMMARAMEAR